MSDRQLSSKDRSAQPRLGDSSWWRASSYEVIGGTHIVPSLHADIETYEPLQEQQVWWGGRRKMRNVAPYVSLADLDLGDDQAICSWCERYGLLGILHHQIESASLWPTWVPFRLPSDIRSVKPEQIYFERGLTLRRVVVEAAYSPQTFRPEAYYGRLLTPDELASAIEQSAGQKDHVETPGARLIGPDGVEREAHVTEGVVHFFPRIDSVTAWTAWHAQDAFPHLSDAKSGLRWTQAGPLADRLAQSRVPDPRSPEFLRAYGEPLHLFRMWAHTLREILEFWEQVGGGSSAELQDRAPVPRSFEMLLRSVSPGARFRSDGDDEGSWQPTWALPSLLAAFGVMILQEIPLGKANIRRCAECGRVMTAAHPSRRYCDETCRGTFNQRKWRERKKVRDDE